MSIDINNTELFQILENELQVFHEFPKPNLKLNTTYKTYDR